MSQTLLVLLVMLAVGYVILLRAYYHTRAELAGVYEESADVFDSFTGTMEIGTQTLLATAAYGAYMQELSYQLIIQIEDPERRQKLLDGMSGARLQYLAMHPAGDTTDPDEYLFSQDAPPPPLEI